MTSRMKMILPCTIAMITVFAMAEDNTTARDHAKRSMALRSAAKRVLEEIDALASDKGVDRIVLSEMMTRKMAEDVQAHKSREASAQLCESVVRDARKSYFNIQLTNAVTTAQTHSPLALEVSEVLENVGSKWTGLVDKKISEFVDSNYKDLFSKTREQAIAVQRRLVDKGISYPSADEIDSELTSLKQKTADPANRLEYNDFKKLSDWIRAFTYKDIKSVFDENMVYVDSLGDKVLSSINAQYNAQLEAADGILSKLSASNDAITSESAKNEMIAAIESFIGKKQRKGTSGEVPVCNIFKIVDNEVTAAAARLEAEKYIAYINSLKSLPVSDSDIEDKILADKPAYRTAEEGVEKLIYEYGVALERFTASGYAKKFKDKTKSYDEYFEKMLRENSAVAASYNKRIRDMLKEKAAPVRQKLSEQDYNKYFSILHDNKPLDENLVVYAHDNRKRFPIEDIKSLVKMFKQAGNATLEALDQNTPLLEETEQKAINLLNKSVAAARDALDEQVRIVHEMEKERHNELEKDVAEGVGVEKILADWADTLEAKWKTVSKEDNLVYSKIFSRTSELLNKTVRQFYKSIEQSQNSPVPSQANEKADIDFVKESEAAIKQNESAEEIEPQESSSGDSGGKAAASAEEQASEMAVSIEMPLSDADCVIILDNSRLFRCDAKLVTQDGVELTSVRISPKKIDEASGDIHDSIKSSIADMLESKKNAGAENPQLKMFVVIKSDDIRHKMSIMLMQKVREQVKAWSKENMPPDKPIELLWSVGF